MPIVYYLTELENEDLDFEARVHSKNGYVEVFNSRGEKIISIETKAEWINLFEMENLIKGIKSVKDQDCHIILLLVDQEDYLLKVYFINRFYGSITYYKPPRFRIKNMEDLISEYRKFLNNYKLSNGSYPFNKIYVVKFDTDTNLIYILASNPEEWEEALRSVIYI